MLNPREVVFYFYLILGVLNLAGGQISCPWDAAQKHEVTPLFQIYKMSFCINSNYVFLGFQVLAGVPVIFFRVPQQAKKLSTSYCLR